MLIPQRLYLAPVGQHSGTHTYIHAYHLYEHTYTLQLYYTNTYIHTFQAAHSFPVVIESNAGELLAKDTVAVNEYDTYVPAIP